MLPFSSAPGNLFNCYGKIGLNLSQIRSYQLSQLTNLTDTINGLVAQYNNESDIQAQVGSFYLSALQAPESLGGVLQQVAQTTINRKVYRDNPRISQNLTQLNVLASIQEVIRQMGLAGATVLAPTITGTPSAFTGTGNGILNLSVNRPFDGRYVENAFAENLLFTCTNDSYTGSATAGNESFLLTGTGAEPDVFAFDWPLGSNANTNLSAIDGDTSNGDGNLLTNSNWNSGSSNLPSSWTADAGTAGTDFALNGGITYGTSANSLQLLGTGATVKLQQDITSQLDALTQYGVCIFARRGASNPGGSLVVRLVDGNGNVIKDQSNAYANSFSISQAVLTTSFVGFIGQFRTPDILPSSVSIQIYGTTTTASTYLAKLSMGLMTKAYLSGPYASIHAGSNPFAINDYATGAITNSRGSGGTLNTFQTLFSRLHPNEMYNQELLLPSSATPSIPDSLIG